MLRVNHAMLVGGAAIVLYAVVLLSSAIPTLVRAAVDDLGIILAACAAGTLAIAAGRVQRTRRAQLSWTLIGLALLCSGLGGTYHAWIDVVRGQPATIPSLADVASLIAAPLLFAGILLRPTLRRRAVSRWLLLIDVGLAMASLLTVCWVLIVGPLFQRLNTDPLVQAVSLANPVAALAILCCLLVAMLREAETRPATGLLLVGLTAAAVAEAAYAGLVITGTYYPGHPVDIVSFAALVVLGVAATVELSAPAEGRVPPPAAVGSPWRFVAPAILVVAASIVVWSVTARRLDQLWTPAVAALSIAWLLLLLRVYLGYRTAVAAHRHERQLRIGHASSFRHEQQRRRQLEAVRDIAAELTRELDLTALLSLITRRAAGLVDAPVGTALLWNEQERVLVPRAWHGLGVWFGDLRMRLGEGASGRAAELRRGVIVNHYASAREAYAPLLAQTPLSAVMAAPVISLGRLLGVIAVADDRPGRVFDEHDLSLLALLADQAAVAIEHAHLFEQAASAEALRELARLKAEFLTTASHELRTPLTLIHGYAELLRFRADALSSTDVAGMADEILLGSRTMIRLVDDLLDFSRLESARPVLDRQRIDVAEVLSRHIRTWQGRAGAERLRLDATPPLEASLDPTSLDQIIRNLIANALEHAAAGPVVVRARHDNGRAGWIRVEVTDEGPGIATEEQSRVWEPFFRGQRALNSPHRGSGLGLAVVRQLVELHGGQVGLESRSGQGSTFWFTLPALA